MTPTERPYKDKEITIRDRETVKLSELTKDERDIYFAGVDEGFESGKMVWLVIIFAVAAIVGLFVLIVNLFNP